jgi:hypothetical protein
MQVFLHLAGDALQSGVGRGWVILGIGRSEPFDEGLLLLCVEGLFSGLEQRVQVFHG